MFAPKRRLPRLRRLSLRKSLFVLPNFLTLMSVLSGFNAILICMGEPNDQDFYSAALLVMLAAFFDTIDGRVARLTKTQTALGVQLDSLADVLSFGMAPAIIAYQWTLHSLGRTGMFVAFVYLACGTIRLARFNVLATADDGTPTAPGKYIVGLPIPAAAAVLIAIMVAHVQTGKLTSAPPIIAAVVLALSAFMVSRIQFRSFKDLRINIRTALGITAALGATAYVALRYHPALALVVLLVSYLTIGLAETILQIARRMRAPQVAEVEANPP